MVEKSFKSGFTIVELLIVIVVIAILAALSLVSYNGITSQARASVVAAAVRDFESEFLRVQVHEGAMPDSCNDVSFPFKDGQYVDCVISPNGADYCIGFSDGTTSYHVTSNSSSPQEGLCQYEITTLAGDGSSNSNDGTGSAASFSGPRGIAVDANNLIYVADSYSNKVRTVTQLGVVTTIAGSTTSGYLDGTGAAARFSGMTAITIGPDGAAYVAEYDNDRVRRITSTGVVTTVAGSGVEGNANGATALTTQLCDPHGIALDSAGNMYVSNANCGPNIKKFATDGSVSTIVSSGLDSVRSLFVGADNLLYISNMGRAQVSTSTLSGANLTNIAGGPWQGGYAEGLASAARFNGVNGVVRDRAGNLYVADQWNNRIRKISASGYVSTIIGNGTQASVDGIGTSAQLNQPELLAIGPDDSLYLVGPGEKKVRKITPVF